MSIKSKQADGQLMLVLGKVHYDKNLNKTVYKMRFPYPEYWIQEDTTLYKIAGDSIISTSSIGLLEGSNMYNILLEQRLEEFGLSESILELEDTEVQSGVVYNTYSPKAPFDQIISNVVSETSEDLIRKISVYDKLGALIIVQSFNKYETVRGLNIPGEIFRVLIQEDSRQTELIQFSNIVINDLENDNMYDYPVPGL